MRDLEIEKEITKLTYFTDQTDELLEGNDYREIEIVTNRIEQIHGKISDLILQFVELKIDEGKSARAVRQWKKETKDKFLRQLDDKERLIAALKENENRIKEKETRAKEREFD